MKRDPIEIVEEMFSILERGRPLSVNELSQATGIHSITIKRYVKLIKLVRQEPELEVMKTARSIILRVRRK